MFANTCSNPVTDTLEKETYSKSAKQTPILCHLHNSTGVFLINTK